MFRWRGYCSQGERGVGLVEIYSFKAFMLYTEYVAYRNSILCSRLYFLHRTYSVLVSQISLMNELLSIVLAKAELLFNGGSGGPSIQGRKHVRCTCLSFKSRRTFLS
jgi:hypothetical protein